MRRECAKNRVKIMKTSLPEAREKLESSTGKLEGSKDERTLLKHKVVHRTAARNAVRSNACKA